MSEPLLSEAQYDAITDEAAQWCMRLHADDCTDAERRRFAKWHAADPRHASEYQAICDVWGLTAHVPAINPAPNLQPLSPPASRGNRRAWHPLMAAAAVIALALPVAGFVGWNQGWVPDAYESYEALDSTRLVTMSDGSRVELNIGTQLTYLNFKDRRSVTLTKGEAFFEVSHDAAHPFIVDAGKGSVRVTGTRFNLWLYQDQVRVNLVEGSVQVRSDRAQPSSDTALTPGMQASYRTGDRQPQVSATKAGDTSLAWRTGKLIFNDLPLSDALPMINRYLPQPILLGDQATGALRLGGSYNTRDLSGLLRSLPRVLPVTVAHNQQGNPVLTKRPANTPRG